MKLATLSILVAVAIATASASPTLELRGGGRANGVSCNASSQCKSKSYCRHGKCDSQKPDGHVCYKDAGCLGGKCDNGKCGKKPPPPPAHPHPRPHPAPHPGPPGSTPPPPPPPPVVPPVIGVLSYKTQDTQPAQLLGEVDEGYDGVDIFEVVQDPQTWTLDDRGHLVSPTNKYLITDGSEIADVTTSAELTNGLAAYICSATSDSTNTQAVLDCVAKVQQGDGSSFSICSTGEIETGTPDCGQVVATFTQLTLTASH